MFCLPALITAPPHLLICVYRATAPPLSTSTHWSEWDVAMSSESVKSSKIQAAKIWCGVTGPQAAVLCASGPCTSIARYQSGGRWGTAGRIGGFDFLLRTFDAISCVLLSDGCTACLPFSYMLTFLCVDVHPKIKLWPNLFFFFFFFYQRRPGRTEAVCRLPLMA